MNLLVGTIPVLLHGIAPAGSVSWRNNAAAHCRGEIRGEILPDSFCCSFRCISQEQFREDKQHYTVYAGQCLARWRRLYLPFYWSRWSPLAWHVTGVVLAQLRATLVYVYRRAGPGRGPVSYSMKPRRVVQSFKSESSNSFRFIDCINQGGTVQNYCTVYTVFEDK